MERDRGSQVERCGPSSIRSPEAAPSLQPQLLERYQFLLLIHQPISLRLETTRTVPNSWISISSFTQKLHSPIIFFQGPKPGSIFVWLVFVFWDNFSVKPWRSWNLLCRPGRPQTNRAPPASAFQLLGLKDHHRSPNLELLTLFLLSNICPCAQLHHHAFTLNQFQILLPAPGDLMPWGSDTLFWPLWACKGYRSTHAGKISIHITF